MRYSLEFTKSALKELQSLDRKTQLRVAARTTEVGADPFGAAAKKLKWMPDHFRVRVGDYRIVYRVDGERVVVVIVRIGHRREVYR